MAFVGESARIVKSTRGIEFTQESKTIAYPKRSGFTLTNEKDVTFDRDVTIRQNDLLGLD
jgi:hypothetical protein